MGIAIEESNWLPLIYEQMQRMQEKTDTLQQTIDELRSQISQKSLTVDTAEAAAMLDVTTQTIRKWNQLGKMPKRVNKDGQNLMWTRKSIENMALGLNKGGAKRKNV